MYRIITANEATRPNEFPNMLNRTFEMDIAGLDNAPEIDDFSVPVPKFRSPYPEIKGYQLIFGLTVYANGYFLVGKNGGLLQVNIEKIAMLEKGDEGNRTVFGRVR